MSNPATETAVQIAEEYLSKIYGIGLWNGYSHREISYAKTALKEIIKLLRENPNVPPLYVIEDFKDKMGIYSLMNECTKIVFAIGYITADDLIECIIS